MAAIQDVATSIADKRQCRGSDRYMLITSAHAHWQ